MTGFLSLRSSSNKCCIRKTAGVKRGNGNASCRLSIRSDAREPGARIRLEETQAQEAKEKEVIDDNIDAPLPTFPRYQNPGLEQADPRFHKPLMKLVKQRLHPPRKQNHRVTRKFPRKKVKFY